MRTNTVIKALEAIHQVTGNTDLQINLLEDYDINIDKQYLYIDTDAGIYFYDGENDMLFKELNIIRSEVK